MIAPEERKTRLTTILVLLSMVTTVISNRCDGDEPKIGEWEATVSAAQCKYTEQVWNEKFPDGFWQLEIALKYLGKKAIEISDTDLPWGWRYTPSTKILAIPADSQIPLSSLLIIADPPPSQAIRVEPKQVLKGAIRLGSYFQGLDEALVVSPVVLFWTWKLDSSSRVGGWVEIPKKTLPPNKNHGEK